MSKHEKSRTKVRLFSWQEWADAVQTDIFEQVTKLRRPILHDDEEKEIREMLDGVS